jgi:hypothetical protein
VPPPTGAVTPSIAGIFTTAVVGVTGNTAVTIPELAAFVVVAPNTVKKFAVIPFKVNPVLGVRIIVAVYAVPATKVPPVPVGTGDHATIPVY